MIGTDKQSEIARETNGGLSGMMVIFDIEWVTDRYEQKLLTQIAAMRVDSGWNPVSRFASLIRPVGLDAMNIGQVGFGGLPKSAYEEAEQIGNAMESLSRWLREDDVLLWWAREPDCVLRTVYRRQLGRSISRKSYFLAELINRRMGNEKRCGLYAIARKNAVHRTGEEHCSVSDVELIAALLKHIRLTPDCVPGRDDIPEADSADLEQHTYWYEIQRGKVHSRDCPELEGKRGLRGFDNITTAIRRGYTPCPVCCAHAFRTAKREYISGRIAKSEYNFVYCKNSRVFHHYSCKNILAAKAMSSIEGTTYYENALATGRCPCNVCRPSPESVRKIGKDRTHYEQQLNRPERQAVKRFAQAKRERQAMMQRTDLTQQQKRDMYTLTQPRFAFWAAQGYQTFHIRDCGKLKGKSHIQGFARYSDAKRAGFVPCRFCKPTAKLDAVLSIPITNQVVEQETTDDLAALCTDAGYAFRQDTAHFQLETPVGIWRIRLAAKPYQVEHINLIRTPDNRTGFHTQPRLFLSLKDIFFYIVRHDNGLAQKAEHPVSGERIVRLSHWKIRKELAK